jgi:hypothetical protein
MRSRKSSCVPSTTSRRWSTVLTSWSALLVLIALLVLPVWGQGTPHSITVGWTFAQGTDIATGFNVYRATVSGGPYTKQTATPLPLLTTTYVDTTGVGGTKYFYVVTSIDAQGNESVNSNEASATFLANPAVPQGVTAVAK